MSNVADLLPVAYHGIFKYKIFNAMQTILVPSILNCDDNIVIASPTGSGKTCLHELAIVRAHIRKEGKDIKCVFIAPNKALCQQRANEWKEKFGKLGLL